MPGRRPIHVTIEYCSDDPPVKYAFKRLMPFLWLKVRNDLVTFDETLDSQSVLIRWAAAKAK